MTVADVLIETQVPGLDTILNGGLNRPSLGVIIGTPGAGKTVLASQIIFNAARQGLKTLVFTSFSEGIEQYIQHMRSLAFFDAAMLGDMVQLLTLTSQLTGEDTSPATAIARVIRSSGAKLVLLDGFQGVEPLLSGDQNMRMLLSALATQIHYLNVTIIATIAGEVRDPQLHTEMTVADVAIGLVYKLEARRHQRLLEVMKLRGRSQWAGLHSYQIDRDGMQVFPRIEGYPPIHTRPLPSGRAPFELPELDQLLEGGPNIGTTTLLAGAPGVGKTTLGLHWALAEANPESTSLFVTFAEHPEQLMQKAAAFGLDAQSAIASGKLRVVRITSVDLNPDRVASIVLAELASRQISRLVIDDLTVLLHELGDRARNYLSALNDIVYNARSTSLYLLEIAPFDGMRLNLSSTPMAVLGDNVVVIQQYEIAGKLRRLLAVLRMRLSFFDRTLREVVLDEKAGIQILAPEDSTYGLLTAGALLSGGVAPETPRSRSDGSAAE